MFNVKRNGASVEITEIPQAFHSVSLKILPMKPELTNAWLLT